MISSLWFFFYSELLCLNFTMHQSYLYTNEWRFCIYICDVTMRGTCHVCLCYELFRLQHILAMCTMWHSILGDDLLISSRIHVPLSLWDHKPISILLHHRHFLLCRLGFTTFLIPMNTCTGSKHQAFDWQLTPDCFIIMFLVFFFIVSNLFFVTAFSSS